MRCAVLLLLLSVGCGDEPEGLPPLDTNKALTQLEPAERQRLCEQTFRAFGSSSAPKNCGEFTVTPQTIAQCLEQTYTGDCTVGLAQACNDEVSGDPCNLISAAQCMELQRCLR